GWPGAGPCGTIVSAVEPAAARALPRPRPSGGRVEHNLIVELKGGIPALVAVVPVIVLIHFVCGHLGLRRLRLGLCLVAAAVSLLVFRRMAPTIASPFDDYLWVATMFAGLYCLFNITEVLVLDVFWRRRGRNQPPGILRDVIATLVAIALLGALLRV